MNLNGNGLEIARPGRCFARGGDRRSSKYFVDTCSRVNTAPESVLYDQLGNVVMDLEKTDMTAMVEAGFKYPRTVQGQSG